MSDICSKIVPSDVYEVGICAICVVATAANLLDGEVVSVARLAGELRAAAGTDDAIDAFVVAEALTSLPAVIVDI